MSKSHIFLLVVAVLLLGVLTYAWMNSDEPAGMEDTMMPAETMDTDATTAIESEGMEMETNSQTEAEAMAMPQNMVMLAENETGIKVTVAGATLTQPGYVVLFRQNSLGTVDTIGSSALLEAGTQAEFSIQTDSAVAKEQQVIAALYADNGDGELQLDGSDTLLTNASGMVVVDIDVIDTDPADESAELMSQARALLE